MKALIKIGGTLLDSPDSRERLAHEIAHQVSGGLESVIVHGGGKQMTRFLADRGIESRFVNGLRVTTSEVLDAVLKILAGTVNSELVAALVAGGARAVGLTGMDGLLTEARQMDAALGFVGEPVRSDAGLLNALIANGCLPVVACVAGDRQGRFYNINADQMASSIASAWRADQLIFLTDVEGVRGADERYCAEITVAESSRLIASGVASGGMRAKLEAATKALDGGVGGVVIAPGAAPGIVGRLLAGERLGTRMLGEVGAIQHG